MRKRERKTKLEQDRLRPCDRSESRPRSKRNHCRPAFTLVEMLIVVSIILIITVAVVAVAPRFTDDRKLSRAADQLAQILLTAKQRSKRDLIPTGVRLFPDPQHNNLITELQYIQQPDDFAPAGSKVFLTTAAVTPPGVAWPTGCNALVASSINPSTGAITGPDFTGGFTDPSLWSVQPGDSLSVSGAAHLIVAVAPTALVLEPVAPSQPVLPGGAGNDAPLTNTGQISVGMYATWTGNPAPVKISKVNNTTFPLSITLTSPAPAGALLGFLPASALSSMPQPTTFSVIRRPRVLQGETPLQLPAGICIDPSLKYVGDPYSFNVMPTAGNPTPADIMFSPQGGTLNSGLAAGQDAIVLWVRDYTKDLGPQLNPGQPANTYPVSSWPPGGQPGDQFVIFLQTHTGFIAEHPVDVTPGNGPYTFTQDARSSGL
jgi:prepilin-type N-terminal cleavage/methylation domain-containing protein